MQILKCDIDAFCPLQWPGRITSVHGPRPSSYSRGPSESPVPGSSLHGLNLSMAARVGASQDSSPRKLLICDYCDAVLTTSHGLEKHINHFHLKKFRYKCEQCGKGFTVKDHYEDHLNMHRNIRVHKCPYCAICFAFKSGLRRHMRKAVCSKYRNTV
ncbi:hypothetical protein ACOMHN_059023 [Nucella lapillus]